MVGPPAIRKVVKTAVFGVYFRGPKQHISAPKRSIGQPDLRSGPLILKTARREAAKGGPGK